MGVLKVRLYRPFDPQALYRSPACRQCEAIAVLDRTKEPGAAGEPLYQDCVAAIYEGLTNGWGALESLPQVSAVVMGCRPRNSRRRWSKRCSTN